MERPSSKERLDRLAVAILQVTQTGRDHFYLHAEVEPGVVSSSFFQIVDDCLVYTASTHEMDEALYDLWLAADPAERWRTLRLEMIGGWHKAEFDPVHPPGAPELPFYGGSDDHDPNAIQEEDRRMMAALRRRFGETMQIVYHSSTRRPLQMPLDFNSIEPLGPA